jgi:hypothetical protein
MHKKFEVLYDENGIQKYNNYKGNLFKGKLPNNLISYINQIPNLAIIIENLKNDEIFRVVVSPEITEKIKDGVYILKKRVDGTGYLPTVADSTSGKFAKQVTLNVENVSNNLELLSSINNIMMQGQLNNIMHGIEEINRKINRILTGQENDRIALNNSAKQQYSEAILVNNDNLKYILLSNVIKTANDSKYQLIETMKNDIEYISDLSDNFIDQLIEGRKYKNKNDRMNSLRRAFITINSATELCSASYFEMHEFDAMKKCINSYGSFIKDIQASDNNIFIKLNSWDDKSDNFWIKYPKKTIENIDNLSSNNNVEELVIDVPIKLLKEYDLYEKM